MSVPAPRLERSLLSMRDPLSRIELAAGQLAREHAGASVLDLIDTLRASVADLDARVEEALGLLRGARLVPPGASDCGSVLIDTTTDLKAVFSARGRRLDTPRVPDEALCDDPGRTRRVALRLLRAAGAWTGPGGRLQLLLDGDTARWCIGVEAERSPAPADAPRPDPADASADDRAADFDALERFARSEGAGFECALPASDATAMRALLWFQAGAGS